MLEQTDKHGSRKPCHVLFVTADRESWRKKQLLIQKLAEIPPTERDSARFKQIQAEILKLDTGGKPVEHETVVLSGPRGIHSKRAKETKNKSSEEGKNPNHWENRTRNLVFLPSGQIRKMHNSLLLQINHTKVIY